MHIGEVELLLSGIGSFIGIFFLEILLHRLLHRPRFVVFIRHEERHVEECAACARRSVRAFSFSCRSALSAYELCAIAVGPGLFVVEHPRLHVVGVVKVARLLFFHLHGVAHASHAEGHDSVFLRLLPRAIAICAVHRRSKRRHTEQCGEDGYRDVRKTLHI